MIVIDRQTDHQFAVGEEVEIIYTFYDIVKCRSIITNQIWWLTKQELIQGREETVPSEYWSGGFAKSH